MRSLQQFWSVRRIGEDRVTLARLGQLRLWLARADKEWGFACQYGDKSDLMDFAQVPEDVVPENMKWTNILFDNAPRDYVFEAVTPRRPLSVRISDTIGIPKGESGKFHLTTPVFVRIRVMMDGYSQSLGIVPSEKTFRSWFGSSVAGRMTCANPTELLMEYKQIVANPNQIVYQVELQNNSDHMLSFEKICLNLKKTGLYSGTNHLWGSPIKIEYFGQNEECQISTVDTKPDTEDGLLEVVPPRKTEIREFTRSVLSCCHLR